MSIKVIDASALAALVFNEPQSDEVAKDLVGARLVAPVLLFYEMASVCHKKIAFYPKQRDVIIDAYNKSLRLEIDPLPINFEILVQTAGQTRLTTYDAAYLWLARTLSAPLVTLDKRLAKAARRFA
ncbi:MAG: type II toxin-antitoxin system VapC family toxin [Gammaproteobacteria bacterium]